MVTRLGLQVRFTDAETGEVFGASGLGDATTTRELSLLNDDNLSDVKFNQSTIGTSTKKALDIACARILLRMIKKGKFTK
jgi:ABC-type dipeptide/oligopeptide/nickel transport system ATPase subunit